jgi:DNA-binding MarR family transcriptional regulator
MPSVASRRRLNDAIAAVNRFSQSRKLGPIHAAKSGVDLNLAAYGVLGQVIAHGPVTLSELAHHTHMLPSALSRQVKLLEDGGYIDRSVDRDDARVSVVRVTSKGSDAHRRIRKANEDLLAHQLSNWSDDELNHLSDLIHRLVADLRR